METLVVERAGGVVTVTLDRPEKKNAINAPMWDELLATFREIADNPDDRVLVVTGAGGAFCSGADLSGGGGARQGPRQGIPSMRHVADVALALHRLPIPVIAKVGGVAAGAGCALALHADLIVASDEARFSMIFARRGLSLDFGASWLLPRLVGLHKAKELALFAEIISAEEAESLGIVNRVVPAGELDGFVDDWAARLAAGPPVALSMTKKMLNTSLQVSMDEALEIEAHVQSTNFATEDTKEAMAAFVEKRTPEFKGY